MGKIRCSVVGAIGAGAGAGDGDGVDGLGRWWYGFRGLGGWGMRIVWGSVLLVGL